MDAIALLKQDHETVNTLFKRFEGAGDGARKEKKKLVDQMIYELAVHAAIEEQLFYPMLRKLDLKGKNLSLEGLEEHLVVKWELNELYKMKATDERYDAKVNVLIDLVRHHVEEEESEFFAKLRQGLSTDELETLGTALEQAKRLAPTRPHPLAPDQPPGNLILGTMTGMLDKGRDLMTGRKAVSRPRAAAKVSRTKAPAKGRAKRAAPKRKATRAKSRRSR